MDLAGQLLFHPLAHEIDVGDDRVAGPAAILLLVADGRQKPAIARADLDLAADLAGKGDRGIGIVHALVQPLEIQRHLRARTGDIQHHANGLARTFHRLLVHLRLRCRTRRGLSGGLRCRRRGAGRLGVLMPTIAGGAHGIEAGHVAGHFGHGVGISRPVDCKAAITVAGLRSAKPRAARVPRRAARPARTAARQPSPWPPKARPRKGRRKSHTRSPLPPPPTRTLP